eukprot:GFUD01033738.1.p1 GENE.GFUD01033738.1~~GFUD01033738.1.p1  ORF type:complete len:167 (+),score=54.46 GFUD01033738.1:88-588(+)
MSRGSSESSSEEEKEEDGEGVIIEVVTRSKRVEWPPRESVERDTPSPLGERVIKLATVPPMHIGTVAITKARRKRIDEDFKNFQGAAPVFTSSPFAKAGFEPNKLSAGKKWKPSESQARSSQPAPQKPHKVLRSSSSVITQEKYCNQTQYKMPPGTARVKNITQVC